MRLELLKQLTEQGQISTFKNSPLWQQAFEEYKKETGDYQVSVKCGSCFRKVLAWLKR